MAIDQHLPPACAFAISVLVERDMDPDAVPEEAVEAAQHHLVTCVRCLASPPVISPPRKKKRPRRSLEADLSEERHMPLPLEAAAPPLPPATERALPSTPVPAVTASASTSAPVPAESVIPAARAAAPVKAPAVLAAPVAPPKVPTPVPAPVSTTLPAIINGPLNCVQCRQKLKEYAEAMDSGENLAMLYPDVQEHLIGCESGCLVLLEIFREEAKASRKYRRRKVRDPFSAIGWEVSGFFRGGQVPMSPMALSYGTLILLLLVSTLSVFFAVRWDDARYIIRPFTGSLSLPPMASA